MPERDLYHDAVKRALIKDGWNITHDPFIIEFEGVRLYADMGAEQTIAAERQGRKIAVEVKTFAGPSFMTELERTVGQHNIYRDFLRRVEPDRELYIAVSEDIFTDFFQRPAIKVIVADEEFHLIVFAPELKEVVQWID